MFIIVTHTGDSDSHAFADAAGPDHVRVLTPRDLSTAGWHLGSGTSPGVDRVVVGGQEILADEVTAVMTRIPAVSTWDLADIARDDRAFVAAEMTAFLLWWLHELSCLVLNPPVPPSLTSPYWPPERLFLTARGLGIPSLSSRRRPESPLDPATALPAEVVTVVGACCVGTPDPSPERVGWARALASAAGVELLAVSFDAKGLLLRADPFVDLTDDMVTRALRGLIGLST